ncbi:DNA-binding protein [Streptomyces sp. NPDC127068]|uniref:DNA-binding protein n=1 Tax=Streptomyces sp. NPDC127068 TaxID=3347127 RepID=UPI003665BC4B
MDSPVTSSRSSAANPCEVLPLDMVKHGSATGVWPARCGCLRVGLRVIAVRDEEAKAASALLMGAGLHGHQYAIDAAVAEAALRQQRPVVMLTSDIDAMVKLCGDQVRLVAV